MEGYVDTVDLIYGGICWTLIVSCVVCAAFRWFHLCYPCHLDPDYYYPARKFVCVFYLCQLLYLPFVLRPSEGHTLLYTRCVELVLTTILLPLILNRFFRPKTRVGFFGGYAFYVLPLTAFALVGVATLFAPANVFLSFPVAFLWVVGVVCALMCLLLLNITLWLWRGIARYHKAEYSNEEDFPYRFAQKVLFVPWVVIAFCWVVFVTGERALMAVLWGCLSVLSVYYGIVILHPQRGAASGAQKGKAPTDPDGEEHGEAENLGEVIAAVDAEEEEVQAREAAQPAREGRDSEAVRRRVVEIARRRYLEPHLMRRHIIAEFDYGERTLAGAVISDFGFYDMINALRLEHARLYAQAHPNETKESVAVSSGFKDRFAMRHAARRIGRGNPEILEGFSPRVV